LELLVFVETVWIVAVAAVGGAAAGLDVGYSVGLGAEDSEECFGGHGAGAYFYVVGLGDDGAAVGPVAF